jgi:photosystem II stability/assembly factor-like uncharacterized protein
MDLCHMQGGSKLKRILLAVLLGIGLPQSAIASGETIGSVSHIHNVEVFQKDILLGTHEGLYRYEKGGKLILLGEEKFDVMGLTIDGKKIWASGHPGPGSKLPEPVGLLHSKDLGKTWVKVSLQGKVDFHQLEASGSQLYGVDSFSGNLMYSQNSGKTWSTLGKNQFTDIAINPVKQGSALALKNGNLVMTNNNLKSFAEIKNKYKFSQIDWTGKRLLATSGSDLLISTNEGKLWKKLFSFEEQIGVLTQSNQLVVVTVGNSLFKSENGGRTFKEA